MSVQAMAWAFGQDIDVPGAKLVLLALANYASNEHGDCFPGQERLAKDTSQGVRTVRRHLAWLEEQHYLERSQRRRKDGSRTSDHIILCLDRDNRPDCPLEGQPAKIDTPTGQNVQSSPANLAGHEPSEEPLGEPSDSESVPFAELERIWNQLCGSRFGRIVKLSPKRKKHLAARFRGEFKGHVEQWRVYCERIAQSSFLCGGNDRGWKPDFDWVINPNNCVKILEGKYDDRRRAAPAANLPTEREQEVLAWIRSDGLLTPTDGDPPTEAEIAAARAKWPERCTREWTRRHATVAA